MECRAEFIGYTFAFLSDVIVGYVMASQYLDKTKYSPQEILADFYTETNKYYGKEGYDPFCVKDSQRNTVKCTTIMDLLKSIDKFEDYEKPRIAGSDEYKEVGAYNELFDKYKKYLETLNELAQELSTSNKKIVTACDDNKVKGGDYKFLIDKNTRPELVKDKNNSLIPKYFKRTNEGSLTNSIKDIMLTKINNSFVYETTLKNGGQIKCLLKNPGQFKDDDPDTRVYQMYDSPDLKNKPWFIGILKDSKGELGLSYPPAIDNETEYLEKNENLISGEQASSIIDLGYLIADAKRELDLIDETIKEKKKVLLNEINRIVESDIGFKPTIKNIFTVLLCNTDAFMEILRRVGQRAEDHHLQYTNNSTFRASKNGDYILSGEEKVYAWPTYSEKGKEKYPGENTNFLDWPEVIFVEDFIKAYFDMNKDVELLNNETEGKVGFDNFVPINPIESRYWEESGETPTPTKYLKTLEDGGKEDELLQVIVERMFLTLDHTFFQPIRKTIDVGYIPNMLGNKGNTPLDDEFIKKIAEIDSWNLLNSIDNVKNLSILSNLTVDQIFNKVKTKIGGKGLFEKVKYEEVTKSTLSTSLFGLKKEDYYVFMSDKEKGIEIKDGIWLHPNPFKSLTNGDKIIKFLSEEKYSAFDKNDPVTIKDDFKTIVGEYKTLFSQKTQNLSFETQNYKTDNTNWPFGNDNNFFSWDEKQQLISFDKPQLYTTLASTWGENIKSVWWTTGSFPTNLESYMGVLTYWDDGAGTTFGANYTNLMSFTTTATRFYIKAGKEERKNYLPGPFYEKMYSKPFNQQDSNNVTTIVALETGENTKNLSPSLNVNCDSSCNKEYPSVATATLITSPLWLDNVFEFRNKFGQNDYTSEKQFKNLAYLFLNTLKPTPLIKRLIENDGYLYNGHQEDQRQSSVIWSLRSFNSVAGLAKVPKFWLLALGSQLWRWGEFVNGELTNDDVQSKWPKWVKPLLSSESPIDTTNKPKGKDPLIQPGFNSVYDENIDETKRFRYGDVQRNNPIFYLNKIYNIDKKYEKEIFKYKSVFKENRINTKDSTDKNIISINTRDDAKPIWFQYFNLYKNQVGSIGEVMKSITPEDVVKNYSWPMTYIAPHHIPYISSELFFTGEYGRGSDFVLLNDGFIGYQDYVTIMPETINKGYYNENMVVSDIFLDDQKVKEHLNEKNYPYYTNRNKTLDGNLGMVLQYLPDNIKNEIVKIFIDWANSTEWAELLKIIDPVNFNNGKLTTHYTYLTGEGSPAVNGFCPSNNKPNSVGFNTLNVEGYGYVLALKQNENLKKLYNEQYWIVNTTPKIWYGYQENGNFNTFYDNGFITSESQVNTYLKEFITRFNSNKNKRKKDLEDKNKPENNDNPLDVGPIDDTDVKLSLYRTFKSMTDKWISASKDGKLFFNITQSGGKYCTGPYNVQRKTLASHFQYVNRTMGDIGDLAVINILKLNELRENKKISLYSYKRHV